MSDAALAILEKQAAIRTNDYVFASSYGATHIGPDTLLKRLKRLGRSDLTAHGFRSTFSDWCAEQTNFPSEVREMALAHRINSAVEAAYRRGDLFEKRRQVMEAWARYVGGTEVLSFPGVRQSALSPVGSQG